MPYREQSPPRSLSAPIRVSIARVISAGIGIAPQPASAHAGLPRSLPPAASVSTPGPAEVIDPNGDAPTDADEAPIAQAATPRVEIEKSRPWIRDIITGSDQCKLSAVGAFYEDDGTPGFGNRNQLHNCFHAAGLEIGLLLRFLPS